MKEAQRSHRWVCGQNKCDFHMRGSTIKLNPPVVAAVFEHSLHISLCRFRYCVSFDPCGLDDASKVQGSPGTYQGHRMSWRNWDLNPGVLGNKAHVLNSAGVGELQGAT